MDLNLKTPGAILKAQLVGIIFLINVWVQYCIKANPYTLITDEAMLVTSTSVVSFSP